MEALLIGAVIGAGLAVACILGGFEVKSKEAWEQAEQRHETTYACMQMVNAENAKLRVALAAGAMTDDGKKIAAMTMAALRTVILTNSRTILGEDHPAFQKETEQVATMATVAPDGVIATGEAAKQAAADEGSARNGFTEIGPKSEEDSLTAFGRNEKRGLFSASSVISSERC